jgi:hypothetical protein
MGNNFFTIKYIAIVSVQILNCTLKSPPSQNLWSKEIFKFKSYFSIQGHKIYEPDKNT